MLKRKKENQLQRSNRRASCRMYWTKLSLTKDACYNCAVTWTMIFQFPFSFLLVQNPLK